MKIKLIILFLIYTTNVFAFVIARTETGVKLKWKSNQGKIPLFINPSLKSNDIKLDVDQSTIAGLSGATYEENLDYYLNERIKEIIKSSIEEWNHKSPLEINPFFDQNSKSKNSFSFTNNPNEFGAGVIAVTKLAYDPNSGDILNAQILMNQSYTNNVNFTVDKKISSDNNAYLGDVITHEIGHLVGLSHSEVIDSSMIYSVFKGQHEIHSDDISGIKKIYGNPVGGTIKGTVNSGGEPIFGINVQLISTNSNKVIQGTISDSEGKFIFENLNNDDSFYILTSPLKNKSTLANYYKNVNSELCPSKEFEPTFYSKCGGRNLGRPQVFSLNNVDKEINVGDVTIRCKENMDTDYYSHKFETGALRNYDLVRVQDHNFFTFSGFFSDHEIEQGLTGQGDRFSIDFSHLDSGDKPMSALELDLNISGLSFGSLLDYAVYFKRKSDVSWSTISKADDHVLNKKNFEYEFKIQLSDDPQENKFDMIVVPLEIQRADAYSSLSAPDVLKNSTNIYSIIGKVQFRDGAPFDIISSYPYDDNSTCQEGNSFYQADPYITQNSISNAAQFDDEDGLGITCGTIDIDGDSNGSGMGSLVIGFFLTFFMLMHGRKTTNLLS